MVYTEYGFNLSDLQKKNLAYAVINNTGISLKLNYNQLLGDFKIPLTNRQITCITKKRNDEKGVILKLSINQLKQMQKSGGFLPLLALLPVIFGGIGAAGGIAGGVSAAVKASNDRIAADKALQEQQRHNRLIEEATKKAVGTGVFLKSGAGVKKSIPKVKLTKMNLKSILNQESGKGIFLQNS